VQPNGSPIVAGLTGGIIIYVFYNIVFALSALGMTFALQSLEAEGQRAGLEGQLNVNFMIRSGGFVALSLTTVFGLILGRRLFQRVSSCMLTSLIAFGTILALVLGAQLVNALFGTVAVWGTVKSNGVVAVLVSALLSAFIFALSLLIGGYYWRMERIIKT
jgi:hypothetical protein